MIQINGLDKLIKMSEKFPAIAEKHIDMAIKRSFARLTGKIKTNAPVHTGGLRDRWNTQIGRFYGKMSAGVPYAFGVEHGTTPHYVSASALDLWARKKGLNPYAVSKSIAKKGTMPNPFFSTSVDDAQGGIDKEFKIALDNITKEISR